MSVKIISLCDRSHNALIPWKRLGYEVEAYDIAEPLNSLDGIPHKKVDLLNVDSVDGDFFIAFPPCTDFAGSGARWWEVKGEPSLAMVNKCFSLAGNRPLIVENPVGRLPDYAGPYDCVVHPYEFSGWLPKENQAQDSYSKRTCLWLRNGAKQPKKKHSGLPIDTKRIHHANGKSLDRDITPIGLSIGIMLANSVLFE